MNSKENDAKADIKKDYFIPTQIIGGISKRLVKGDGGLEIASRLLVALLVFGFIAYGIPLLVGFHVGEYLFDSWQAWLMLSWLVIAPIIIDFFEYSYDDFWRRYRELKRYEEKDKNGKDEFEKFKEDARKGVFKTPWRWAIPAAIFYVVGFYSAPIILQGSYTSPVILVLDIQMFFGAIMWGILAHLVICSVWLIWRVSRDEDIMVDPFNPDGLGGLASLGDMSIKVTFFLSSLSLYIPYAFYIIGKGGYDKGLNNLVLVGVISLIVAILATFLVPMMMIHGLAKKAKNNVVRRIGENLYGELTTKDDTGDSEIKTLTNNIRIFLTLEGYREAKKMAVWPFDTKVIFELIASIILPIATFTISHFKLFSG